MITDTITEEARDQIRQMQGEIERLTNQLVKARAALGYAKAQLVTLGGDSRKNIADDGDPHGDEIQAAVLDKIDAALTDEKGN